MLVTIDQYNKTNQYYWAILFIILVIGVCIAMSYLFYNGLEYIVVQDARERYQRAEAMGCMEYVSRSINDIN
jgi:hypothetical protein